MDLRAQSSEQVPFTEQVNPMSTELDGGLDPSSFLRTLRAADSQIFGGYKGESGILDLPCLTQIGKVAETCAGFIESSTKVCNGKLVFSGCGTSGRIAYLTARRYESILDQLHCTRETAVFDYTCAGGDSALLLSDELPEDDPQQGRAALVDAISKGAVQEAYLVGVTCGLSAPYVAGQVAAVLADDLQIEGRQCGAAVVGFNPVSMARDMPVDGLPGGHATIRDVFLHLDRVSALDLNDAMRAMLNPIIGPEPVTASSRMKGGSAALVILDAICLRTLSGTQLLSDAPNRFSDLKRLSSLDLDDIILEYSYTHARTYTKLGAAMPPIMLSSASSLSQVHAHRFVDLLI